MKAEEESEKSAEWMLGHYEALKDNRKINDNYKAAVYWQARFKQEREEKEDLEGRLEEIGDHDWLMQRAVYKNLNK